METTGIDLGLGALSDLQAIGVLRPAAGACRPQHARVAQHTPPPTMPCKPRGVGLLGLGRTVLHVMKSLGSRLPWQVDRPWPGVGAGQSSAESQHRRGRLRPGPLWGRGAGSSRGGAGARSCRSSRCGWALPSQGLRLGARVASAGRRGPVSALGAGVTLTCWSCVRGCPQPLGSQPLPAQENV